MEEFKELWRRVIFDATGDNSKALRAIELAQVNGLFDPLIDIQRMRALLAECAQRLQYDGDLWHDQGIEDRRDASWGMAMQVREALGHQ